MSIKRGDLMNRRQLAGVLAKKLHITKKQADDFLTTFIETIREVLSRGEPVKLIGLGTFKVRKRRPKRVAHPQTHEPIWLPGGYVVKFEASRELNKYVRVMRNEKMED